MRVVAIKNMSAGNETVGEMWNETKIFDSTDSLEDVMKWGKGRDKRIVLTVPENDADKFNKINLEDFEF